MFQRIRDMWMRKADEKAYAADVRWQQLYGYPERYYHKPPHTIDDPEKRQRAEEYFRGLKINLNRRTNWIKDNFLYPMIKAGQGHLALSHEENSGVLYFGTYGGIRDLDLRPGAVGARVRINMNEFNYRMDTVMQDKIPTLSPEPLSPEYAYNQPKAFLLLEREDYPEIAGEFKKFLKRHFDDATVTSILEPLKPEEIAPITRRWLSVAELRA